jgi:hypothetical protein
MPAKASAQSLQAILFSGWQWKKLSRSCYGAHQVGKSGFLHGKS